MIESLDKKITDFVRLLDEFDNDEERFNFVLSCYVLLINELSLYNYDFDKAEDSKSFISACYVLSKINNDD